MAKNPPAKVGDSGDSGFDPWVGKIPWRRKWQPTPVFFLVLEIPWTEGAWWTTVHGVAKEWDKIKQTKQLIRLIMVRLL